MLNIALCIGCLEGGGAQRVACLLANAWAEAGHSVTVFHHDAHANRFPFPQSDAVVLNRLPLNHPANRRWKALLRIFRDAWTLRKALVRHNPDVVVSILPHANVLTLLACAGTGFRVVITELCHPGHEDIAHIWKWLRKWTYPRAAQLVVQTRDIHDWFGHEQNRSSVIIPNPVPRPGLEHTPKDERERKTIIAAARLSYQKNIGDLVRAFVRLADKHPDWDLHVYGQGDELDHLHKIIGDAALEKRIILPGWTDELTAKLAGADMFVLSSRFEGMPMALAEAMAVGLPCVSTDCPSGPADYIVSGRNGLLVPVEDLDALTKAMDKLMTDQALRERLGREAKLITETFSFDTVMAAWEACLKGRPSCRNGQRQDQTAETR